VRTRVKICGCAGVDDVAVAVDAGADAVGVVLAEKSRRRVRIEQFHAIAQHVPALVTLVAVFVDPAASLVDEALKVGALPQFHGRESADTCESFAGGPYLKAYHVEPDGDLDVAAFEVFARPYTHATWLLDTAGIDGASGGTGRTFAWGAARALAATRRVVIAGGLTPENVADCVRAVRPYAVDVSGGVETDGKKDPAKIRAFLRAVREADGVLA
jgi:phosphoribosylanthranilate isomerase